MKSSVLSKSRSAHHKSLTHKKNPSANHHPHANPKSTPQNAQQKICDACTNSKSIYNRALGASLAARLDGKGLALWKKYVALSLKIREIEVAELLKDSVRLSNELAKINRHEKINALLAAGKRGDAECLGDYLVEGFLGESVESMGSRESFLGEEFMGRENFNKKRNHSTNSKSIYNSATGALNGKLKSSKKGPINPLKNFAECSNGNCANGECSCKGDWNGKRRSRTTGTARLEKLKEQRNEILGRLGRAAGLRL